MISVLAVSQLGATCGPGGPGIPDPDDCGNPGAGAVITALEIGPPGDGDFVPWQDGDPVVVTIGGQGSAMIQFRVRATGAGLTECMTQHTVITGDPTLSAMADYESPLHWYADPGGGMTTRTAFAILNREPGLTEPVLVETTVQGVAVMRALVYQP